MPERDTSGDDEVDFDSDDVDREGVHGLDLGGDGAADSVDGGAVGWTGLTEPERELADELDRIRGLEATRDRFVRDAGIGPGSGGSGAVSGIDRDALAIVQAAGRFGGVELTDEEMAEVEAITDALAQHAVEPPPDPDVYRFRAVIVKQGTTATGQISLTMTIPWEYHDEVFRSLDTMPFTARIEMTGVAPLEMPDE
jgi:hypothetical protein